MSWLRRLQGLGLAVGAFLTLSAEDLQLDEQELECEQAVAHLASCCPGYVSNKINCTVRQCGPAVDLSLEASRCIEGDACDVILSKGLCDVDGHSDPTSNTHTFPLDMAACK